MPGFLDRIQEFAGSILGTGDEQDTQSSWLPSLFQSEEPAVLQPGLGASAAAIASAMGHWAEDGAPQADPAVGPATAPRARETPGGPEGVVYLGLNDRARGTESKVFNGMENATVIEGHGADSEMQGKIMSTDGKTALDLSKDEDVNRYLRESGVGALRTDADGKPLETEEQAAARLASLQTFFVGEQGEDGTRTGGLPTDMRDEMAGFVKTLQSVEQGETRMDRLVISGHSFGDSVFSDTTGNDMSFKQLGALMQHFPQAQGGVEDLMLSACHTLEKQYGTDDGQQYKDIFPELNTTWAYNGFSPSFEQGSSGHIRNWERASRGDDPNAVRQAARRQGSNATAKVYPDEP
jgi:hypothetical protein